MLTKTQEIFGAARDSRNPIIHPHFTGGQTAAPSPRINCVSKVSCTPKFYLSLSLHLPPSSSLLQWVGVGGNVEVTGREHL